MNFMKEKQSICEYGRMLVTSRLVVRTWGNMSMRVDEDMMLITPSGRAYEDLTERDIVSVRISDRSWEGDLKPSSEKDLHAEIYLSRPETGAVIHTHQPYASALAVSRKSFSVPGDACASLLGKEIPCAAYALPTTAKLARAVKRIVDSGEYHAILLANHGAVCFHTDIRKAYEAAMALEDYSREIIIEGFRKVTGTAGGEDDLRRWYAEGGRQHV